jgi:serine/threonine-protein kinase RsbW
VRASTLFEDAGASEEDLTAIELALAEVLNNVVEHAYEDIGEGEMDLCIDVQPPDVYIRVLDSGIPMPKGRLPLGKAADTSRPAFEQDEGGYGLFMIRQLARKLRYARNGDRNQLSFRITLGAERNWDTDLPL